MALSSTRLEYIKITATHRVHCYNWYTNARVMQLIKGQPLTHDEADARFDHILTMNSDNSIMGFYSVKLINSETHIGIAKLVFHEDEDAEVGYGMLPEYWGNGYAKEILASLINRSKEIDSIKNLIGLVNRKNHASIEILRTHGFLFNKNYLENGQSFSKFVLKLID